MILGYVEIDKFKVEKEIKYYDMLKDMAEFEISSARLVINIFHVTRHKNSGKNSCKTQTC